MIKELRLKNWKSFEEATLYIDPLTILIGTNASGKSNLLDGLLFLHRISSGVGIFQAINGDVNLPPLRGGIEWVCLKPYNVFSLEVLTDGVKENQDCRYKLEVKVNDARVEVLDEKLTLLTYESDKESPKEEVFLKQQGAHGLEHLSHWHSMLIQVATLPIDLDDRGIIRHVLRQFKQIFVFDPIPSHMRNYSSFSDTLSSDGSNIAGVLAALEQTRRDEVEATITQYLKALPERDIKRVWSEPVGKFKSDAMLYCQEGWEDTVTHEIDARGMSDGTLRYLAIVTALLTRERGSLLVVEEVDNGLHPSRAHILIDMLRTLGKERGIDVIVTTHNPALLDAAGVGMLPFITVVHRDDKTGVSQLIQLEDIEKLPKLIASGSLGRLNAEGRIESALKQENAR